MPEKIKVPKEIKVAGQLIKIFYEPKLSDNHGKYGQARLRECEIALEARDMPDSMKTHTLIHELLHFIDSFYNDYTLSEETTNALATGLHTLLVDMGVEFDWSNFEEVKDEV